MNVEKKGTRQNHIKVNPSIVSFIAQSHFHCLSFGTPCDQCFSNKASYLVLQLQQHLPTFLLHISQYISMYQKRCWIFAKLTLMPGGNKKVTHT